MTEIDGSRALLREFDEWQHRHPLRIGLLVRWIRKFRKALAAEVERREAAERVVEAARELLDIVEPAPQYIPEGLDLLSTALAAYDALASQEKP